MSIIYRMVCDECDCVLEHEAKLDTDEDLLVTVKPCGACMESLADEKVEENKRLKRKLADAAETLLDAMGIEDAGDIPTILRYAASAIRKSRGEGSDYEDDGLAAMAIAVECSKDNPCCDRANEYNGFGSGPLVFVCPKHCPCHD